MAEQSNKDIHDIFIANSIYPDVRSIFTRLQTLDEIKDECYVVLDTNVLLTPYTIGKDDLLDQYRKTFKPLSSEKRLIVPGQVAREFAKNRAIKIAELYQQISGKQVPSMQKGKYPLLSSLDKYEELVRLEEEIDKKLDEYRQTFKKAIENMKSHIREWRWNDPVTLLYNEIFDEDTIIDPTFDKEEMQKDLEHRQLYKIPPGYKDHAKDDRGIGDLLIWHTILEVGKTRKKSVIFVSGDEKTDWYLKGEGGSALYPRYELVDEFRRSSEGQTFHILKFSLFLELYGASKEVVDQVRKEEASLINSGRVIDIKSEKEVTKAIVNWLFTMYLGVASISNSDSGLPNIVFTDATGSRVGAIYNLYLHAEDAFILLKQLIQVINISFNVTSLYDEFLVFMVYCDALQADKARDIIDHEIALSEILLPDKVSFIVGYLSDDIFLSISIFCLQK